MRPVMPLARFLYGDTHKWYFRTAGTALAATLVTAISIRFKGDARWVAYLLSFAGVSVLYWLIYAPAKWADKDCVVKSYSSFGFHEPVLAYDAAREISFGHHSVGEHAEQRIPVEIELLHKYAVVSGRRRSAGPYLCQREWRPPGYWPGHREFVDLQRTAEAHRNILSSLLVHDDEAEIMFENMKKGNHRPELAAAITLTLALYLDACRPNWRRHAELWSNRKWRRALMWHLWRHTPLRV